MSLRSLHDALDSWKPADASVDPLAAIRSVWSEVAGAQVATNSQPVELRRGVLLLVTRSSAWSQQLGFLADRIVSALNERVPQAGVRQLRFRVGRISTRASAASAAAQAVRPPRPSRAARAPAADVHEALAHFREDIDNYGRAKRAAGWKECRQCGVWIAARTGPECSSCASADADQRAKSIARLLYDTPWLGFEGAKRLVCGLSRDEYELIRRRLLKRWWDMLQRALRSERLSRDGRERLIAGSYVLLKTGIDPERIAPQTVRNELGESLHDLIYGTEYNHK
jgi:hypothetical protein